jgi:hypothetical protein
VYPRTHIGGGERIGAGDATVCLNQLGRDGRKLIGTDEVGSGT